MSTDRPSPHESPFLTASWRDIVMVTWAIDPSALRPYLAAGTELDLWDGNALASVVAFDFRDTRVLGFRIPFHVRFPEVNLRFYVRRRTRDGTWRRGVTFIQEMVPRTAIAVVARTVYGEPYVSRPMRRTAVPDQPLSTIAPGASHSLAYAWKRDGEWERVVADVMEPPHAMRRGSVESFIAEHYWGYTRRERKPTLEYRVEHPEWKISTAVDCRFEANMSTLYGPRFAGMLAAPPVSTFVADGSDVVVYQGQPAR
ncbi:MAG TPA: DUF2071 domain-containing protein [Gemmatimonas sp.]|nr:DUF2071 domain-containing protein [Gemmatimonas sp.]